MLGVACFGVNAIKQQGFDIFISFKISEIV